MQLRNEGASILIPDGVPAGIALQRTTHLGIGAHSDDLEIMAYHGIAACYREPDRWFDGITCTNGTGSSRSGAVAEASDAEMRSLRREEQERAATIGEYGFVAQLDYASSEIADESAALRDDLTDLLRATRPRIVYAHSPADKHTTHISVVLATIAALRTLAPEHRPDTVYGCEAWRDLDWMNDEDKVLLDVSLHPELATRLLEVFESQIGAGKRYDLAAQGRRAANATFHAPRAADRHEAVWLAMDLSPLVHDDSLDVAEYVNGFVERFARDVRTGLTGGRRPMED